MVSQSPVGICDDCRDEPTRRGFDGVGRKNEWIVEDCAGPGSLAGYVGGSFKIFAKEGW